MKSNTIKLASLVLAGFFLLAFTADKPANKPTKTGKDYNGYWVAKSGEEYIIVSSARIPEHALEKDSKGDLKNIDKEAVKASLRFSNQDKVNGKQIDSHFFVVTEDGGETNVNSVAPGVKGVGAKMLNCTSTICRAVEVCFGASYQFWVKCGRGCNGILYNCSYHGCSHYFGASNYCVAINTYTGAFYYIMC